MTGDDLTGTLQSRGQEDGVSYCVIDSQRYNVPQYVLDWMAKMQKPLQNGETILYSRRQDKEGGEWTLTKIRRPPKEGSGFQTGKKIKGKPQQIMQKSGILIASYQNGCTVRMANGDINYAVHGKLPEVELPQHMDFAIDSQSFIVSHTYRRKADIALKENLDRMNGPADGETIEPPGGELIKAPATAPEEATVKPQGKPTADPVEKGITDNPGKVSQNTDTLPAPTFATLTIVHTVNLGNYESLKVGIEGQAVDREEIELFLDDTLARYGRNHPATMDAIDTYRRRVMGVQT